MSKVKIERPASERFKSEKVCTAKEVKGATLKAIRAQSGKNMDSLAQPNSGMNDDSDK